MVDVIPLCVDTYLLADVIAMWQMLNHIWFYVFSMSDVLSTWYVFTPA